MNFAERAAQRPLRRRRRELFHLRSRGDKNRQIQYAVLLAPTNSSPPAKAPRYGLVDDFSSGTLPTSEISATCARPDASASSRMMYPGSVSLHPAVGT